MEPAVRGARTQSGIATAPDSRIPDCGSAKPRIRALKAQPPGTEFLDAETGRQNSRQNARTPGETKIREMSGRKSPQKRPIWRRIGNAWFARNLRGHPQVVRDEEHREIELAADLDQKLQHLVLYRDIQRGDRLVADQEFRLHR